MAINFIRRHFRKSLEEYLPRIMKKNKSIYEIVNSLKRRYDEKEIVDYFRDNYENNFIFLTDTGDLFLHGEKLNSFDCWLHTVINLLNFSKAHEVYEKFIDVKWNKDKQLKCADTLHKCKRISSEQYLYMIEIINCLSIKSLESH